MAAPIVRSTGSVSGAVTGGRDDLDIGETVTLSDTQAANAGASYVWSLEDLPIGSSVTLTNPTSATPTFIPDVTGSYRVKCVVNGSDTAAATVIGVWLAYTHSRIPSFEERLEYTGSGNAKGWHQAMTQFMRAVDLALVDLAAASGGLPDVGTPNTYAYPASITTDAKGRVTAVTAGTNPATIYVPLTRTISTTGPLAGGGALSGNLTLTIGAASGVAAGTMSSTDFTKVAGIAALTTKGDLLGFTTVPTRVAVGTNDYVLTADSTAAAGWAWKAAASSGANALGTYLVQTATNAPANAQVMASLATGFAKVTTTTGVISTQATIATADIANNAVTVGKMAQLAALSVLGNGTNGTADPAAITAGTTGHVLRRSGTALAFGTIEAGALAGTQTNGFVATLVAGVPTWAAAAGGAIAITNNVIPIGNGTTIVDSTLTLASNAFTHAASSGAGTVSLLISNTSAAATANVATIEARVTSTSTGNPKWILGITSGTSWTGQVNNATADQFELLAAATVTATVSTAGAWLYPKSPGTAPTAFGDRLTSGTSSPQQVEIGNTSGNTYLCIGQHGDNNLSLGWTYNANAALGVAFIKTAFVQNGLEFDASSLTFNKSVAGNIGFWGASATSGTRVMFVADGTAPTAAPSSGHYALSITGRPAYVDTSGVLHV